MSNLPGGVFGVVVVFLVVAVTNTYAVKNAENKIY